MHLHQLHQVLHICSFDLLKIIKFIITIIISINIKYKIIRHSTTRNKLLFFMKYGMYIKLFIIIDYYLNLKINNQFNGSIINIGSRV